MALIGEKDVNLAFNTDTIKTAGEKYKEMATELQKLAVELENILSELQEKGWTTPAGKAIHALVTTSWKDNMDKYTSLLELLSDIMTDAAGQYDDLVTDHIEKTVISD